MDSTKGETYKKEIKAKKVFDFLDQSQESPLKSSKVDPAVHYLFK